MNHSLKRMPKLMNFSEFHVPAVSKHESKKFFLLGKRPMSKCSRFRQSKNPYQIVSNSTETELSNKLIYKTVSI